MQGRGEIVDDGLWALQTDGETKEAVGDAGCHSLVCRDIGVGHAGGVGDKCLDRADMLNEPAEPQAFDNGARVRKIAFQLKADDCAVCAQMLLASNFLLFAGCQ